LYTLKHASARSIDGQPLSAISIHWSNRRLLWAGVLVVVIHASLLLAVIPSLSSRLSTSYNREIFTDGYDYLAGNLASGHGYRFYPDTALTMMREPGFPIFLAGLFICFGRNIVAITVANMLLAFATAWMITIISMRALAEPHRDNRRLALIPALLFLFCPGTLVAESRGGVEIFFGLLITVFLFTVQRCIEKNRTRDYVTSGIVLGLTVLVRSTPMLFPVPLLAYLICFEGGRIPRLVACRNVGLMTMVMVAVLSPWIVRNYSLTGAFVPTASVFGVSAQAGQYIGKHMFEGRPQWLLDREASRIRDRVANDLGLRFEDDGAGYYQVFYESGDEIKFSSYLAHMVADEYRRDPLLFVRCVAQNLLGFWIAGKTWIATGANALVQIPLLLAAIFGAVEFVKRGNGKVVGPMILFVVYMVAVHAPVLAQARYSIPLLPILAIFATRGGLALKATTDLTSAAMPKTSSV
jgi:Dolichyl-phosphate-mannose-protein mannosyltransferase